MVRKFYDVEYETNGGDFPAEISIDDVIKKWVYDTPLQPLKEVVKKAMQEWAGIVSAECEAARENLIIEIAHLTGDCGLKEAQRVEWASLAIKKEAAIAELIEYVQRINGGESPDKTYMEYLIQTYKK